MRYCSPNLCLVNFISFLLIIYIYINHDKVLLNPQSNISI